MTVTLDYQPVKLDLPVMPMKRRRGDPRNYRRWHCWVEAVRALAAHYKDDGSRPAPAAARPTRRS